MALLPAVDPAAPDGGRLVGYTLLTNGVDRSAVKTFLARLKAAVIQPEQVITASLGSARRPPTGSSGEVSSAERVPRRLNRGGSRRLNSILHRAALTQIPCSPSAQAYVSRRAAEGKTKREARRALKRFIVRALWKQWRLCWWPGACEDWT